MQPIQSSIPHQDISNPRNFVRCNPCKPRVSVPLTLRAALFRGANLGTRPPHDLPCFTVSPPPPIRSPGGQPMKGFCSLPSVLTMISSSLWGKDAVDHQKGSCSCNLSVNSYRSVLFDMAYPRIFFTGTQNARLQRSWRRRFQRRRCPRRTRTSPVCLFLCSFSSWWNKFPM